MNDILVVVEHLDGKVKDITMELIGAAVSIKEEMSAKVIVLVIANDPETISQSIKYEGVDEIVMVPIDID
ncbi:MAG: electron transfer flavoprotein subunit alpha/FixB family protein, partial [Opitutae bacterium]|nr:electron transfer flavoprotein subunit alpha/FixB family protein [Opitutae bacterium]